MKNILMLALVSLTLAVPSFADGIDYSTQEGIQVGDESIGFVESTPDVSKEQEEVQNEAALVADSNENVTLPEGPSIAAR